MSQPDIRLAMDIGLHAGHEACKRISDICGTIEPGHESTIAALIAMNVVILKLETLKEKYPAITILADIIDVKAFLATKHQSETGKE